MNEWMNEWNRKEFELVSWIPTNVSCSFLCWWWLAIWSAVNGVAHLLKHCAFTVSNNPHYNFPQLIQVVLPYYISAASYFDLVWQSEKTDQRPVSEWSSLDLRPRSQKFHSLANNLASIFSLVRWEVWTGWFGSCFPALRFSGGEKA